MSLRYHCPALQYLFSPLTVKRPTCSSTAADCRTVVPVGLNWAVSASWVSLTKRKSLFTPAVKADVSSKGLSSACPNATAQHETLEDLIAFLLQQVQTK